MEALARQVVVERSYQIGGREEGSTTWLLFHGCSLMQSRLGLHLAAAVRCSMSQAGHSERGKPAVSCRRLSAGRSVAE